MRFRALVAFAAVTLLAGCARAPSAPPPRAPAAPPASAPRPVAVAAPSPPESPPESPAAAPPLARVIDDAERANRPILLELSAAWCEGCRELEKNVLPSPDVAAALGAFLVQHYDIEVGPGVEVRDRFAVSELPQLLVLAPDGSEIGRAQARAAAPLALELTALAKIAAGGPLTAERLANERDPRTLLLGARAAERTGNRDAAERLYVRARDGADAAHDDALATSARFALLKWEAWRDDGARHRALLLAFAEAHPQAAEARAARAQADVFADRAHPPTLDPLAFVPARGQGQASFDPHPEIRAALMRQLEIAHGIGARCASAPRTADEAAEPLRLWVDHGRVTRALLLDAEAAPELKACVEQAARDAGDVPPQLGSPLLLEVMFPKHP